MGIFTIFPSFSFFFPLKSPAGSKAVGFFFFSQALIAMLSKAGAPQGITRIELHLLGFLLSPYSFCHLHPCLLNYEVGSSALPLTTVSLQHKEERLNIKLTG